MSKTLRLGTRGSLLAVTQSTLIKNQIEELTKRNVELIKIVTQGDQNTEKPLWQIDGKDFFTKELDEALLAKEIDFVVHSYKDLGSVRPKGIHLAAITKRSFAQDILLIKKETINRLKDLKEIIVGTSSPRRIVNIESSLKDFLPTPHKDCKIKCETLRGNVNTRIGKLRDDKYHAIILAFAGLERLAIGEGSHAELVQLLDGLDFMVLPQSEFTSSASQGALALECLESNQEVRDILNKLNDKTTSEEIAVERDFFQKYGGGCHLAVGIYCKKINNKMYYVQKGKTDKQTIHEKSFLESSLEDDFGKHKKSHVFLGLPLDKITSKRPHFIYDEMIIKEPLKNRIENNQCYFVTTNYAQETLNGINGFKFVSGNKTWKSLSKQGHWINGSADSFGHDEIVSFKESKLLQIFFNSKKWFVLTNKDSKSEVGETFPCYERTKQQPTQDFIEKLKVAKVFYWTSFYQYHEYKPFLPTGSIIHACGLGKTLDEFIKNNVEITPVADMNHFLDFFSK